jgi:hypothetical protein
VKFTVKTDNFENVRMILDIDHEDALELGNALLDAAIEAKQTRSQTVVYRHVDRTFGAIKNRFFCTTPFSNDDSELYSMPVRVSYKQA